MLSRAANCTSASWLTQFNKTSYQPISDENGVTWSATSQWDVEERVRRQKCSNEAEKTSWTRGDWLSVITWLECSSLIGCWRVCLLFNEGRAGEECWKEAVCEGTWLLHYRWNCWAAATMTRDRHVTDTWQTRTDTWYWSYLKRATNYRAKQKQQDQGILRSKLN